MEISTILNESLHYLETHPETAGLIIGLWAFLETAFALGVFLPAEKVLILGGVLVSKGYIKPYYFILSVTLGTFLGYTVSYFLGYYLGEPALKKLLSKFKINHGSYEKVKKFLEEKGVISILVGRFIAVVRALLPIVVGAFKMPFLKFTVWNFVGALLWSTFYLFLGGLIGNLISIIIRNKTAGIILAGVVLVLYVIWRKYEENRKNTNQ